MIKKLSHATIWVTDHEQALAFYRDKLGFEVRMDHELEGFRWLTVGAPEQKDVDLVLMETAASPMLDEDSVGQLRELLARGVMGTGVLETDDCRATYEELSAKGVEFIQGPEERPYGVEAIMKDPFGNWFSVTEPRWLSPNGGVGRAP